MTNNLMYFAILLPAMMSLLAFGTRTVVRAGRK